MTSPPPSASPAPRRPLLAGVLALCALLFPSACDDHLIGFSAPITTNCNREPPLTYENFGQGFVDQFCRGCHGVNKRVGQRAGAPLGVDFDTFEDIVFWADRIEARAVDTEGMP